MNSLRNLLHTAFHSFTIAKSCGDLNFYTDKLKIIFQQAQHVTIHDKWKSKNALVKKKLKKEKCKWTEIRVARWFVFEPKNPNSGKLLRAFDGKMLIYFRAI
jgi:hypothetical protein